MYSLNWTKPPPLVPRRCGASRKCGPQGDVRSPLDEASVVAACERLAEENVAAVAIRLSPCLRQSGHEQRSADIAREVPEIDVFITCSSDILPEIREYDALRQRSLTHIWDQFSPGISSHCNGTWKQIDVAAPVQVAKSDGGVAQEAAATQKPAYISKVRPRSRRYRCSGEG